MASFISAARKQAHNVPVLLEITGFFNFRSSFEIFYADPTV